MFITSFWDDLTAAEEIGYRKVQDTYTQIFHDWRHDYKYLAELVFVLQLKACHYQNRNDVISDLYVTLYEVTDNYAIDSLKGYELQYFFEITA